MLFTWTLGIVIYIYNRWFVYIAAFVDRWLVWQFLWSVEIFWDVNIGRMASDVIYFCGKLMDLCFRGYDKQLLTLSVSCRFGRWFFWSLNMSFVFEKRKRKKTWSYNNVEFSFFRGDQKVDLFGMPQNMFRCVKWIKITDNSFYYYARSGMNI